MLNTLSIFLGCLLQVLPPVGGAQVVGDKKELDCRVTELIMQGSTERFHPVDPHSMPLHKTDSTEVLRSLGATYMIDKVSNDLYYSTWDDTLKILWDERYPLQSLTNLLLGQIESPDFTIDLTHRRYGNERPQFLVDWASLYHTLCPEGVRPYASSARREEGHALRGIVLFHHPDGNYVHMLVFSVTPEQLFSDDVKTRVLKADLFTNIPQHNILNLYE